MTKDVTHDDAHADVVHANVFGDDLQDNVAIGDVPTGTRLFIFSFMTTRSPM
jgi:hypothetical protein